MVTKNEVYTHLVDNLPNIYCTQYYEVVPEQLPCVYFRESHAPIRKNLTLALDDEQVRMYIYLEIYGEDIDELVEEVEGIMKGIWFVEELCEMIPNYAPEIQRVSMRFCRVITGGTTLTGE